MSRDPDITDQAIAEFFEKNDPALNKNSAVELESIRKSIGESGEWSDREEWRISTCHDLRIASVVLSGSQWFLVSVECDGQVFSCKCPTLEKAFLVSKFYRHIIVRQYYSVGPPWAASR